MYIQNQTIRMKSFFASYDLTHYMFNRKCPITTTVLPSDIATEPTNFKTQQWIFNSTISDTHLYHASTERAFIYRLC